MIPDQSGNPYPTISADTITPLYEGASTSARMGDRRLSGNSAIRRRGRHLERNNAVVKSALESFVSSMIGVGVTPEFCFTNPAQAEEVYLWMVAKQGGDMTEVVEVTQIAVVQYLVGIRLALAIAGSICGAMLCIIGWAIYVTRWKTTVDIEINTLKDKSPVSEKDCLASHENCEKHIAAEFGHGAV